MTATTATTMTMTMTTGLLRYHAALLLRSYRWIAPVLFFAVVAGSATAGGPAAADAFGFVAAALVPTSAWLVRIMTTAEPAAARACLAAAGGTARAQLAALGVAVAGGMLLALVSAPIALLMGAGTGTPELPPTWQVLLAGLVGDLVCVLVGVAAGALSSPPLLRGAAAGLLSTGLFVVLALVSSVSPAAAAIRVVVAGADAPEVHLPLQPLAVAVGLVTMAAIGSGLVARGRGVD